MLETAEIHQVKITVINGIKYLDYQDFLSVWKHVRWPNSNVEEAIDAAWEKNGDTENRKCLK